MNKLSFHSDPHDPEWKVTKLKTEPGTVKDHHNTSSSKVKYSQKFCEKWLSIFSPWLSRCEDDPNKPFCRACQCRLDCNRCHLQRHERTSKHARNLEILVNKGEGAARQNLSIRQERSKYYQQRKKICSSVGSQEDSEMGMEDYIDEADQGTEYGFEQTDTNSEDQYTHEESICKQEAITVDEMNHHMIVARSATKNNVGRPRKVIKTVENSSVHGVEEVVDRKDPMKRLMQIQRDKSELMDSFKELMGSSAPHLSPPREKNHVDLFFESVSSSVKALSPKLIAETKMRVSQLICELELRALTENEQANNAQNPSSTVVVSQESSGGSYIINQPVTHVSSNHQSDTHQQVNEAHHYEALS
ncbi:protein suppressor of variegation 3-7-like [Lucilia cuprina]|uniref:protein suppressor of variegation 3-7-like n=1 Tax=Lucilia cuprina TaxID=7375 RepID=UPI001F054FE9|nr:protein suppressor of variegation 3-7-like [Lucilia cuprina]